MARVLVDGLGAREIYDCHADQFSLSREKFFLLGGVWVAVMEGEPPRERTYQHVAFAVAGTDLPKYRTALESVGVDIRPSRPRVDGEGQSLYFYDFDNHLFELHTGTLEQRLARYADACAEHSREPTRPGDVLRLDCQRLEASS